MMGRRIAMLLMLVAACLSSTAFASRHSADVDGNYAVSLQELLRVIQFFNSGRFGCGGGTDGYAPNSTDETCRPHDSDFSPRNWRISLPELLRLIQFFNSGGYRAECGTADNFAPGQGVGNPCPPEGEPEGEGGAEGEGEGGVPAIEAAFFALNVSGQAPLTVQFLDISRSTGAPISSWSWDFGDGGSSAGANPKHTYTTPGVYDVTLTVNAGGLPSSLTQVGLITVLPLGAAKLISASPSEGDDNVAVTRETILEFGAPLDSATVNSNSIYLMRGIQKLGGFRNLSPDGRRVTLFPSTPMPGKTLIRVVIDGDLLKTVDGRFIDGDGDGVAGGKGAVNFTTLGLTTVPGTAVCGRVFASEFGVGGKGAPVNKPLSGVEIFVDGRFDLRTTTDENGNFRLAPVPPGEFFVHVNGLTVNTADINGVPTPTSFPAGPYYPFVGKSWHAVAGQETNVGNVFLPLIPAGALKEVSPSSATLIDFAPSVLAAYPEYAGTRIVVPPNALYNDFGARGGQIGIAPVPPDRLPTPLPPGLELPLVITVQSSGPNNFDTPVPVCFPNVPQPDTGAPLPPGAKSALWSFDHDIGDWTVIGPMTVSSDGTTICTDPGVGILEPGWHGSRPGSGPSPFQRRPCTDPSQAYRYSGAPRPCRVDSTSCGTSILLGALDCGTSFVPLLGQAGETAECTYSIVTASIGLWRNCLNPPAGSDPDRTGCAISGTAGIVGVLGDCSGAFAASIPVLGQIIACGSAVVDVARNCRCTVSKGLEEDPVIAELEKTIAMLQAFRAVIIAELGSAKWTDTEWDDEDAPANAQRVNAILELVGNSMAQESGGGEVITPAEAAAIQALPLPQGFSSADVNALIDYRNTSTALWAQGLYTHALAGRTDIMDRDAITAALDLMLVRLAAFSSKSTTTFDLKGLSARVTTALIDSITEPDSDTIQFGTMDYALIDTATGFASRGRLTPGGELRVAALTPNRFYKVLLYDLATRAYAELGIGAAGNGEVTQLPRLLLVPIEDTLDSDDDGLPDLAEAVYNTGKTNPDTDGDGVNDLAELEQGMDPLGGLPAGAGFLAAVDTPGNATGVSATGEFVAVADGSEGVALFNVFNGMNPILVAQIATDGAAERIAAGNRYAAVAEGVKGVSLLDVASTAAARRIGQFGGGSFATAVISVAIAEPFAYAGTRDRRILVFDLPSGALLDVVTLSEPVAGLSIAGDTMVALGSSFVTVMRFAANGTPQVVGTFAHTQPAGNSIFNADPVIYFTHFNGYDTVSIANRAVPVQLGRATLPAIGTFGSVTANGSGIALATLSRSFTDWPVGVFDASSPSSPSSLLSEFDTSGTPLDVSIFNGLGYVADGNGGLLVLGYLPTDTNGVPPGVSFAVANASDSLEANSIAAIRATVSDDVQVRNVELLVDGQRVQNDGTFPFEFRLRVPDRSTQNTLSLAVAAYDTGGSRTATSPVVYNITPDVTPPSLLSSVPGDGRMAAAVSRIELIMSETIHPTALTLGAVTLSSLGADGLPGGGDDSEVPLASLTLTGGDTRILITPAVAPLPEGLYELRINATAVEDLAGNSAATDLAVVFGSIEEPGAAALFTPIAGGMWDDPLNWSNGRVPGSSDAIIIRVPGRDTAVNLPDASVTVKSIDSSERLVLGTFSSLNISGNSFLRGGLDLGGSLGVSGSGTVLRVEGPVTATGIAQISLSSGTRAEFPGTTALDGLTISLANAALSMPVLASLTNGALIAAGAACEFSLPALSNLNGSRLVLTSTPALTLPLIASYQTLGKLGVGFSVGDTTLSLPALGSFPGSGTVNLTATFGGTLALASLTTGRSGLNLTVNGATANLPALNAWHGTLTLRNAGVFSAAGVANLDDASIDVDSAALTLNNPFSLTGTQLRVSGTGTLGLPQVASFTACRLEASGNSAQLLVSGVTSVNTDIIASNGGSIVLDLESISVVEDSDVSISASGASRVDLSVATTLSIDGGVGGNGQLSLSASASSSIDLSGIATVDRTGDTNIFLASSSGSTINLTSATQLNGPVTFSLSGSGEVLLDALQTLESAGSINGGGVLHCPSLQSISGSLGAFQSQIFLPALSSMSGFDLSLNEAQWSSELLTTVGDSSLTMTAAAAAFEAPLLTALTNTSLSLYQGAVLSLGVVTSFTADHDGLVSLFVQGAGSALSLPALGAIELLGASSTLNATASSGGALSFPLVTTITTPASGNTASFNASGSGSTINLNSLTTFNPARVSFNESGGGIINKP